MSIEWSAAQGNAHNICCHYCRINANRRKKPPSYRLRMVVLFAPLVIVKEQAKSSLLATQTNFNHAKCKTQDMMTTNESTALMLRNS